MTEGSLVLQGVLDRPSKVSAPLMLKLLVVSMLLPGEVSVRLSGLYLSPARLILLVLVPVVLVRAIQSVFAGHYRFVWSDLLVPATGLWLFYALNETEGLEGALTSAGPLALEYCVGYMAVRFLLKESGQAIAFVGFLCWSIAVVALLGLPDPLTNTFPMHEMARAVFGGQSGSDGGSRLGFLRAASTLDHPILFGATCSFGLLIAAAVPIRGRTFAICCCGLGTFLALSSAPIQGVLIGFCLLAYARVVGAMPGRWAILIILASAALGTIFWVVDNPFGFVFNHLVFDVESAYYRIYIWQMAGAAISDSPWVGLGFVFPDAYEIPGTIDSIWLVWSLWFGIPAAVLLGSSMIAAVSLPTSGPRAHLTDAETRLGRVLGIIIFLIFYLGFTVDFFGEEWILLPVLVGVRAHLGALGRRGTEMTSEGARLARNTALASGSHPHLSPAT